MQQQYTTTLAGMYVRMTNAGGLRFSLFCASLAHSTVTQCLSACNLLLVCSFVVWNYKLNTFSAGKRRQQQQQQHLWLTNRGVRLTYYAILVRCGRPNCNSTHWPSHSSHSHLLLLRNFLSFVGSNEFLCNFPYVLVCWSLNDILRSADRLGANGEFRESRWKETTCAVLVSGFGRVFRIKKKIQLKLQKLLFSTNFKLIFFTKNH